MRAEVEEEEFRGGPGWLATFVGAGILLAAGFALGLVVGAVREEPAIVLRYVTGQGAQVPAPAAVPAAAPAPQDAAPEPAPAPAPAPLREAPADPPPPGPVIAPAAPPEPSAPVAAAPSPGRFAVQVGAFADSAQAERLEAELRGKGLPVYVQPTTGDRASRWRVRVGPLDSRAEADRLALRLKTEERLPVWVLEETGT